jgi:hypothetical protein
MIGLARLVRRVRGCPPGWQLTRAISEGIQPRVAWHLAGCPPCAEDHRELQALAAQARSTLAPVDRMPRDRREALGARLRVSVSLVRPRSAGRIGRAWWWAPAAAMTVALAVWGAESRLGSSWRAALIATQPIAAAPATLPPTTEILAPNDPGALEWKAPAESRALIRAIGQARFTRAQLLPDEIVRVDDGEIELEISPLHAGERFRVVTDDGDVEVRGTSFKVAVTEHRLAAVHVWRGQVQVRSGDGAFVTLDAGDDWVRDPALPSHARLPAAAAPARATTSAASRLDHAASSHRRSARSSASRASLATPDPTAGAQTSFAHAWSLLRSGDPRAAAAELAQLQRQARGRDIEEDALYWRAVALHRSDDGAGAVACFAEFLERFPASSRAGEAAAALGWLLLQAGDRRGARQAFERAAGDPSPHVRSDAQQGLRRTQADDR